MKKIFTAVLALGSLCATAQNKITSAIITTTTTITAPEGGQESIEDIGGQGQRGGRFSFGGAEGDTKSVTYVKDSMVKTSINTDMMRMNILRNNNSKVTTTLMEMMGKKMGFYASDADAEISRLKQDSMMQARNNKDTSKKVRKPAEKKKPEIVYGEGTKKIAGYVCNKAYVVSTNILGQKDSSVIWYSPEIQFEHMESTGGSAGLSFLSDATNSFEGIKGFVMEYDVKMPQKRNMHVVVNKIETNKDVKDKEFEIAKDFELKPMSEMRTMFSGLGGGPSGGGNIRIQRD